MDIRTIGNICVKQSAANSDNVSGTNAKIVLFYLYE
jgi:hypothetical protein